MLHSDVAHEAPSGLVGTDDAVLAGFLVSDTITMVTRASADVPATQWVGRIGGTHATKLLDEADEVPVGTTITLRRRKGETLLDAPSVVELARRYGEMRAEPLDVLGPDGEAERVNRRPPWLSDDAMVVAEYGMHLLGSDPLDIIPLKSTAAGTFGVAYILPASPAPRARQPHRLYRDGILVADSGVEILPEWAFFACCAIDVTKLPLSDIREQLGQALRNWLLWLSARMPRRLSAFVSAHHLALKIHAAHDRELARIIVRWLPVETSAGRLTISELLGRTRHIRYAVSRDAFRQLAPIAGRSAPFVNAGHLHDVRFLEQLPSLYDNVTVERIDVNDLLSELDDPPLANRMTQLSLIENADEALLTTGCVTLVKSFEPATIPALFVPEKNALCLNDRNPIVQRLARLRDRTVLSRTVQLLHAQARLLGHQPLRGVDTELLQGALADLIQLAALEEGIDGLNHD